MGKSSVNEVVVRQLLMLYRDRECWLTVREMAQRCGISTSCAEKIIRRYRMGQIDADGLKTAPLFPEIFRKGNACSQLCFPF
ncbi:hypothetical protein [Geomesophilobacter sediminis]|uniref:Helix-turn-helix domain-containing protein n=1 Tax=Geomesophilobacter sediminis TaxID=2798584 RepID=A0A8J7JER8_9BACT|nr:hypothetical protein [Geomesophilobacter sediminis]MBJ6724629.1 hypothetical protein [Geomesophilobacter sediminis]